MGKNRRRPRPAVEVEPEPEPELMLGYREELEEDPQQKEDADGDRGASDSGCEEISEEERERRERENIRKNKARERQKMLRSYLDGSLVLEDLLRRNLGLLLYVFVWMIILIWNGYRSVEVNQKRQAVRNELKGLRHVYISTKAELMTLGSQTSVAGLVDTLGVKESVVPPYVIEYNENDK